MWCISRKSQDKYVDEWENEIESIIINIKKAKTLGKVCMKKRLLGRKDLTLQKEILELIREIDHDVINTKRKAVQFLSNDTTLCTQRQEKLNFYQDYIKKQINILKMKKTILELKKNNRMLSEDNEPLKEQNLILLQYFMQIYQNSNMPEGPSDAENAIAWEDIQYLKKLYDKPVVIDSKSTHVQELYKHQFENILHKYDTMIYKLEKYYEEVQIYFKPVNDLTSQDNECVSILNKRHELLSLEDREFLKEISFWLERELENQKLLQEQFSVEMHCDEDLKKASLSNRLKFTFPSVFQRKTKQSKDLEKPILQYKDEVRYSKPGTSKQPMEDFPLSKISRDDNA